MANDSNHPESKRRTFLKSTLGGGAIVGLAGCSGSSNQDTTTTTTSGDSTVTATPDEDTEYEELPTYHYISFTRSYNAQLYEEGVLYRQMLSQLGFDFEVETLEIGAYVDKLLKRNWDLTNLTWSGSPENLMPYSNFYRSFSKDFIAKGEPNYSHWMHPEYEEALQKFVTATDQPKYQEKLADYLQEILALNQPVIWALHPDALSAVNTSSWGNWRGIPGTVTYSNRFTFENLKKKGNDNFVVWGQTTGPDRFPNPMGNTNQQGQYLTFMFMDHLVGYNDKAELFGRAATDWKFVEDNVIQIKLREGMKFHDGKEVTAEDVKFTFDYYTKHGYPSVASDIAAYKSAEVKDKYTVNLTLESASIAFPATAMYLVFILPKHIWKDVMKNNDLSHPREWNDPQMTIGSGPFKFKEYEPGNRVVLEKFQDHYNADAYKFDQLIFKEYGTNATLVSDIGRNKTTFAQYLGANDFNRAKGMKNVKATSSGGLETRGVWINAINNSDNEKYRVGETNEPFNDVYVRRALAHALDKQQVIGTVYQGNAARATNYVAPANKRFYNPDVPKYDVNLDKARQLLLDSGLRYNDKGKLLKPVDWKPRKEYLSPGEIPQA